jgi:uncharacterized protein YjbI with pentapeptide repeats
MRAWIRVVGLLGTLALAASGFASPLTAGGNYAGTSHVDENHQNLTLTNIILDGATLTGTNFRRTIFDGGSLIGANFSNSAAANTNLTQTSFVGANLTNATFVNANLNSSSFAGANLAGANFSGATNGASVNWTGAMYSATTQLPAGLSAAQLASMTFVNEPALASLLALGLAGLALFARYGRPRAH